MLQLEIVDRNIRHDQDFTYQSPYGFTFWLLILTHTPAIFRVNDMEIEYPAGTMVLYPANTSLYYRARGDYYENDYLRFHVTADSDIPKGTPMGIPVTIPLADLCHQYFAALCTENYTINQFREANNDALIHLLLHKLAQFHTTEKSSPKYLELLSLRQKIYSDYGRNWTIANMAEQLHISQGHLQTIYRNAFQVTCMDDVIAARIYAAKEQLTYSDIPVTEIGYRCGYHTPEHFFRQFKKSTGYTPTQYRKKYQAQHS